MKILGSGVLIKIIAPANYAEVLKGIRERFNHTVTPTGSAVSIAPDSVTLGKGVVLQLGEDFKHEPIDAEFPDELVERMVTDAGGSESIDAAAFKSAMSGAMKEMVAAISGRNTLPTLHVGDKVFFHLAAVDAVPDSDNQFLISARCINAVEEAE